MDSKKKLVLVTVLFSIISLYGLKTGIDNSLVISVRQIFLFNETSYLASIETERKILAKQAAYKLTTEATWPLNTSTAPTDLFGLDRYKRIREMMKQEVGDYPGTIKYSVSRIFNTSRVTNEHKYKFIVKPKLEECEASSQKKVLLLAVVVIGAEFEEKRNLIRSSWGNKTGLRSDMRVIFAVALSLNEQTNKKIEQEAHKYNDILQEDFIDDYFNLTIKVIGAFKYVTENCRPDSYSFVMRINDDVVVRRDELIKLLKSFTSPKNLIIGHMLTMSPSIRSQNKWMVKESEFAGDYFLPYMEGSAFIATSDLVRNMYNLSRYVYWLPFSKSLEDVYIGMLCIHLQANYYGISIRFRIEVIKPSMESVRLDNSNLTTMMMVTKPKPDDLLFVIAHDPDNFKYAWEYFQATV